MEHIQEGGIQLAERAIRTRRIYKNGTDKRGVYKRAIYKRAEYRSGIQEAEYKRGIYMGQILEQEKDT